MIIFEVLRQEKTAEDSAFELNSIERQQSAPVLPGNYIPAAAAGAATAVGLKRMLVSRAGADRGLLTHSPSSYLAAAGGLYAAHRLRNALNAREAQDQSGS